MKKSMTKTSRNLDRNPVARAVARQNLISAFSSYRIKIFMNEQGQPAASDYLSLSAIFKATLGAMNSFDSDEVITIQKGWKKIGRAEARGWTWDKEDAVALDNALQVVQSEFPKLSPEAANESIRQVFKGVR